MGHSYAALRWWAKKEVPEDAVSPQMKQVRGVPSRPEDAALHSDVERRFRAFPPYGPIGGAGVLGELVPGVAASAVRGHLLFWEVRGGIGGGLGGFVRAVRVCV